MKLLRLSALILIVIVLPSCGDSPTSPMGPSPTPTPSTPASVTATVTVSSAAAATDYNIGALQRTLRLLVNTQLTNSGTEDATVSNREFDFFSTGGATRTRSRPEQVVVPGSSTITLADEFFFTNNPNGNFGELDVLRERLDWSQISDGTIGGTIDTGDLDFANELADIVDADPCAPNGTTLCLRNGRFEVSATWENFDGTTGVATVLPGTTFEEGSFWFFDPQNTELLVKVLDGCMDNGHYWVFAAGLTNVETTITVSDTMGGSTRTYNAPLGTPAPAVLDTTAFATCPGPVPLPAPND